MKQWTTGPSIYNHPHFTSISKYKWIYYRTYKWWVPSRKVYSVNLARGRRLSVRRLPITSSIQKTVYMIVENAKSEDTKSRIFEIPERTLLKYTLPTTILQNAPLYLSLPSWKELYYGEPTYLSYTCCLSSKGFGSNTQRQNKQKIAVSKIVWKTRSRFWVFINTGSVMNTNWKDMAKWANRRLHSE